MLNFNLVCKGTAISYGCLGAVHDVSEINKQALHYFPPMNDPFCLLSHCIPGVLKRILLEIQTKTILKWFEYVHYNRLIVPRGWMRPCLLTLYHFRIVINIQRASDENAARTVQCKVPWSLLYYCFGATQYIYELLQAIVAQACCTAGICELW